MSAPTVMVVDSLTGMADVTVRAMREGRRPDPEPRDGSAAEIGQATREQTIGCRLSFHWLGQSRAVYGTHLRSAAETFEAEADSLRLSKKLLDARHPHVRALTALRGEAREVWLNRTLPYPEPGVRLLRRDRVGELSERAHDLSVRITLAARNLEADRREILRRAEERLGQLFNPTDYPSNFANSFGLLLTFPPVEPPEYLLGLNPEVYRREQERIRAAFELAVTTAQNEFGDELARLVTHLRERLTEGADGRPHVFRDSALGNVREFIDRVRSVSIETDGALQALLDDTAALLDGVSPGALRQDGALRAHVAEELAGLEEQITVALPARRIRRLADAMPAEGGNSE